MVDETFYWHDYETFGRHPAEDRAAQFAGIRTDTELNVLGDPLVLYCSPPKDYLPDPEACMLTGISPQQALAKGVTEARFIAQIQREFMRAPTCVVGYNNIRFDDEFTRHLLYRNFFDPYAREWQGGNSRFDLIDVVRLTRALRPGGIEWPVGEDGRPSNRLEALTAANGLLHDQAHDALSDVYATIALAQLIQREKPKLFRYTLRLRDKRYVARLLNYQTRDLFVHSSGMIGSEYLNTSVFVPLAPHPSNRNGVIAYDLRYDPEPFFALDEDTLRQCLYTAKEALPESLQRLPLKVVHLNKCPMVCPIATLNETALARLQLDLGQCQRHREQIVAQSEWIARCTNLFQPADFGTPTDPDLMLYSGGFFSNETRRWMSEIPNKRPAELGELEPPVDDARLPEMLFRYRARNFPETLSMGERVQWKEHCQLWYEHRATPQTPSRLEAYRQSLEALSPTDEGQQKMLEQLRSYAQSLCGSPAVAS